MKIVFVVVFLAAISTVLAHDHHHHHVEAPASAPEPSSSDASSLGSFIGVYVFSFVAYYLHFHA